VFVEANGVRVCAVSLYFDINVKKSCSKNNSMAQLSRWQPVSHNRRKKQAHICKPGYNRVPFSFLIKFPSPAHTLNSSLKHHFHFTGMERGERAGSRWMMIIQAHSLFSSSSLH